MTTRHLPSTKRRVRKGPGRPAKRRRSVNWNVAIPEDISREVQRRLAKEPGAPFEYGARTHLVTELLRRWLDLDARRQDDAVLASQPTTKFIRKLWR